MGRSSRRCTASAAATARRSPRSSATWKRRSRTRPGRWRTVTPVGLTRPNDQRIREEYGSKSVSLSNVNDAYDKSTPREYRSEFSWSPEEAARAEKWAAFASELTTNMHEVIGHGSGKV